MVRHGQSEWNKLNQFTGFHDADITEKGREEARVTAEVLKKRGIMPEVCFTSVLRRAYITLDIILDVLGVQNVEIIRNMNLNERDYGDLTGMNKDEARKEFGVEQVHIWRRSYDVRPPAGECLEDVVARVIPYYKENILPEIEAGKTVLIVAHGNSLRALVKYLNDIPDEDIPNFEIATGQPLFFAKDDDGKLVQVD